MDVKWAKKPVKDKFEFLVAGYFFDRSISQVAKVARLSRNTVTSRFMDIHNVIQTYSPLSPWRLSKNRGGELGIPFLQLLNNAERCFKNCPIRDYAEPYLRCPCPYHMETFNKRPHRDVFFYIKKITPNKHRSILKGKNFHFGLQRAYINYKAYFININDSYDDMQGEYLKPISTNIGQPLDKKEIDKIRRKRVQLFSKLLKQGFWERVTTR